MSQSISYSRSSWARYGEIIISKEGDARETVPMLVESV
jgi:hypothetical protein